ncbi:MAG TPA: hypothetical protein VF002_04385 [Gaiellaceae bacterium]
MRSSHKKTKGLELAELTSRKHLFTDGPGRHADDEPREEDMLAEVEQASRKQAEQAAERTPA